MSHLSESSGSSIRDFVHSSLSFDGKACSVRDLGGKATIASEVTNLVKNLVGAGMLALPNGVASFANAPSALVPAFVFDVLMASIFGYFFWLIGRTCRMRQSATYREVWEDTVGDTGAVWVALVNMLKPAMGNLAYSMILADTFTSLSSTLGWGLLRSECLLLVSVIALLPLCLLKNLDVLATTSLIGTLSMLATAVVMGIRYFDGTYDYDSNGRFVNDLSESLRPSFGSVGAVGAFHPSSLVLVCMLNEAFIAHYNSPRFYAELKNNTVQRFAFVVEYSFGISCLLYFVVMSFGFLTFGENSNGYILNNYSTKDELATICRVLVAVSLICTYPVTFMGVRDGVLDVFHVPMSKHTSTNLNIVSILLLTIITVIALIFEDVGKINAVGGGTLGTILVFVFPTMMFRRAIVLVQQEESESSLPSMMTSDEQYRQWLTKEAMLVTTLMWVGIVLGVIGVYFTIVRE